LLWVGCAPSELHEVGALLLGIYLRRAGYRVHYLGQNLPVEDFAAEVHRRQPAMILFSASTLSAAEELGRLTAHLTGSGRTTPLIGYGGQIFNRRPDLRSAIAGVYMGATAQEAVAHINDLLAERPRPEP
jgi:methanogenic corrinoid protein MtbC1